MLQAFSPPAVTRSPSTAPYCSPLALVVFFFCSSAAFLLPFMVTALLSSAALACMPSSISSSLVFRRPSGPLARSCRRAQKRRGHHLSAPADFLSSSMT